MAWLAVLTAFIVHMTNDKVGSHPKTKSAGMPVISALEEILDRARWPMFITIHCLPQNYQKCSTAWIVYKCNIYQVNYGLHTLQSRWSLHYTIGLTQCMERHPGVLHSPNNHL
jgi:hypothetical protein